MFDSIDQAKEYFKGDLFAGNIGICIDEIGGNYAVCSLKIRDDHKNAMGNVMGGVYFTLADFAAAVITNHIHSPSVAMSSNINFTAPAKGDYLYARAEILKSGKTVTFCEVKVTDSYGRLTAVLNGTSYNL